MQSLTGKEISSTGSFTKDQGNAYNNIIEWLKKPFDSKDYKRALVGPAGTGKTYLIKSIIDNCDFVYSKIGLAAPTHKATRVLQSSISGISCSVKTLQSDLGLRLNLQSDNFNPDNPPFDPKGTIKVGNFSFYIVDEASMVSKSLVTLLERICLQNGVKLLYSGDSSQLAPVNENYSSAFKGVITYTLKEIVRQDEDNPVKYLLDLLRYDIKNRTYKFLEYISRHKYQIDEGNTKGFYVCNTQEFNQQVINNFNDSEFVRNIDLARIVAYTNAAVTSWNSFVRNNLVINHDKSIITKHDLMLSYVTIVDDFLAPVITNSEEYIIKDICNYTHPEYGIKGFMVTFIGIHGGNNTTPLFVVNHADIESVKLYKNIIDKLRNDAMRYKNSSGWKKYYEFKNKVLISTNILDANTMRIVTNRDIDYGFAITAHRSQGSTYQNVLVDVNDMVYDKNGNPYTDIDDLNRRIYVACSRCRNKLFLRYGI